MQFLSRDKCVPMLAATTATNFFSVRQSRSLISRASWRFRNCEPNPHLSVRAVPAVCGIYDRHRRFRPHTANDKIQKIDSKTPVSAGGQS